MTSDSYERAWNSLCDVIEYSGIFDSPKRQLHSGCMEDTRVALRDRLKRILDQPDRTNVWLDGLAGVGKTSIAFSVAEEMRKAKRLAATFFFSHKHAQSAAAIIPTIAYQLALAFPLIRAEIITAIVTDRMLLSSEKSRRDQMQELVIKPLFRLKHRQESYAIIIDALDESFSAEEVAGLVTLLAETLAGPDLPNIHLIFTSRPDAHIRAAMQGHAQEILLTTRDEDTIQDVRFFLRASLDKIQKRRPTIFGQQPTSWPSEYGFETLVFKAGGLFVYAAMAVHFISAAGHNPKQRLDLLLEEKSTVGADIDQLYRQIFRTSKDHISHCRLLASIIHLHHPLRLVELQELFHVDRQSLDVMLEAFSPVILNPSDGNDNVEIYHASLRDFMIDPRRSKEYYVDVAKAHEQIAHYCLDFFVRGEPRRPSDAWFVLRSSSSASSYPFECWARHLSMAHPSNELRDLLAQFTEKTLQRWVSNSKDTRMLASLNRYLASARKTLYAKWFWDLRGQLIAWQVGRAFQETEQYAASLA